MRVPFLDLKATYLELEKEINEDFQRVLNSGWYILGKEVENFEAEFAGYCNARNCIGVANGLSAISLALLACGIRVGDEVLVPSNTYIATWLAVTHIGAIPVPVEPKLNSHTINVDLIENKITNKTKAIIPVHLYGRPCEMDKILLIAKKYSLKVIEDAAQAHGAKFRAQKIGAHGDAVAWSFYPGKNLGCFGDAGAITTNCDKIDEKIKSLRNYGSNKKYYNEEIGYNSRLDPLQAAFLRTKLKKIDVWNTRRKKIADRYLSNISSATLVLPPRDDFHDSAWHLFVVRSECRETFQKFLTEKRIETLIHYPIPPNLQKAYSDTDFTMHDTQIAQKLANEVISLPIGPHLSEEQTEFVISVVNEFSG